VVPNSGVHYNPLESVLRYRSLGPISRVSDSVFLGGAPEEEASKCQVITDAAGPGTILSEPLV